MSVAVCAIKGVCSFVRSVPWPLRKLSSAGICSRSEGTFGLSRVKWTLSKTMLKTCLTSLPRWQLDDSSFELSLRPSLACAGTAATQPMESAATTASRISRFMPYPLIASKPTASGRADAPRSDDNPWPVIRRLARRYRRPSLMSSKRHLHVAGRIVQQRLQLVFRHRLAAGDHRVPDLAEVGGQRLLDSGPGRIRGERAAVAQLLLECAGLCGGGQRGVHAELLDVAGLCFAADQPLHPLVGRALVLAGFGDGEAAPTDVDHVARMTGWKGRRAELHVLQFCRQPWSADRDRELAGRKHRVDACAVLLQHSGVHVFRADALK